MAIVYTQSQLDAIRRAYASGALRVTHEGRTTEFRSRQDMAQIIAEIENNLAIGGETVQPIRRLRMVGQKGLY